MPRNQSVFHNVVTDENSTTQLLCNLLQFDDFRAPFLELILPGVDSSEVVWGHIDTQIVYDKCGRPDIRIRNESVLALIEVKVGQNTDCTENQPKGYMDFLRERNEPIRRLVFLVPSDWFKLDELRRELQSLQSIGADGRRVDTSIVTWDDVVKMIDAYVHVLDKGKPFIEEFRRRLVGWVVPKPMAFKSDEIGMLQQVIVGIKRAAEAKGYKVRREGPGESREYGFWDGLYFLNLGSKDSFYFGVWGLFWEEHGFPLCFGVRETWGKEVEKAFIVTYERGVKPYRKYLLGEIDKQVLDRPDVVSEIWSFIEPIVKATVAARPLGPARDSVTIQ
jgi:hypothetical protein